MNTKYKYGAKVLISTWLIAYGTTVPAVMPANITDAELALIPKYCPYTQGFKLGSPQIAPSPEASRWVSLMGSSFWHLHHYCTALINLRRSEKATLSAADKAALRGAAMWDLLYVTNNSPEDFILLPEIYTWIGRTEIRNRSPQKASQAFAKARTLKPDYWPAYSHWVEYLISAGNKTEAFEIAKLGLQHSPDAKVLAELFRKLGGDPSSISPLRAKKEEIMPQEGD